MVNSKIYLHYPIHLQDIINAMMVSSWRMEHTPSGDCNESMIVLILMQLILKLGIKFKAYFWVQFHCKVILAENRDGGAYHHYS